MAENSLTTVVPSAYFLLLYFAIGGGLYITLSGEWMGFRNEADYLSYIARSSLLFCFVGLTVGLATIGLLVAGQLGCLPEAGIPAVSFMQRPDFLIHLISQIAATAIYRRQQHLLSVPGHLLWSGTYFLTSLLLLLSIKDGSTPVLLILRASFCLVLAGLATSLAAVREKKSDLKVGFMRRSGWLVFGSIFVTVVCQLLLFASVANPTAYWQISIFLSCLLLPMTALGMIFFPRSAGYVSAGILLALASAAAVSFEWGYLAK